MLISLNQKKFCRNFAALIGICIITGVQGFLNDRVSLNDNFKLNSHTEIMNELSNSLTNEEYSFVSIDGVNDKDLGISEKYTDSRYLNVSEHPGELCNRVCVKGHQRICYFEFTLEYYQAMGVACGDCAKGVKKDCNNPQCVVGDGVEKGLMSINRQLPGPAIQVCHDDFVIVDVSNHAHGSTASLHWHGLHMVETPYMDGVPFLTQCPISFSNTFRYQFYATEPGTHFYHSHSGHHKANGQYGALIVRREEEPLNVLYDYDLPDHYIIISDWMHKFAEQHSPGLPSSPISPDSVLINGRGVYTNVETNEQTKVPPTIYYVTPGSRYRFRFINSINHACPFQMQIENHSFKIIASDSYDVYAQEFDTLVSNPGERYDFILDAKYKRGDYLIRIRGLGLCSGNRIESFALIRYKTNENNYSPDDLQIPPFPKYEELYPPGIFLNHPNSTCWLGKNKNCITELSAYEEDEELLHATPDHKFFLSFDNSIVDNKEIFKPGQYKNFFNPLLNLTLMGTINNISMVFPSYPPLTQPGRIDESQFCDNRNRPASCEGHHVCPCTHRLKVKLNSIVELILVDESKEIGIINHPFHLHGYRFMVTGLGQDPHGVPMSINRAQIMENFGLLRRYPDRRPPFKDTVSIPSRGYAVVRFRATNPGFWLLHCHYEWHLAIGMALFLQVGDISQMVKAPNDFPKCDNYVPPVRSRPKDHFSDWNLSAKNSL